MHLEILKNNTSKVWNEIKSFDGLENFYLAGGTGLAFQIGHRISIDFDFFSTDPIKKNLLDNLETFFKRPLQVLVKSNNELIFLIRQFFEKQVSDYTKNNI